MQSSRLNNANNKADENDMRTNARQRTENVDYKNQNKLPELKRTALGEVGNIVRKIETRGAAKKASQPLKPPSTGMFKDVKSKVDSHWKKNEIATSNDGRVNSNGRDPILVTTKSVQVAKPEVAKKVTIKSDGSSNGIAVVSQLQIKRPASFLRPASNIIQVSPLPNDVLEIDGEDDASKLRLASEYVKDIYAYLFQQERKFAIRENYLEGQEKVTKGMRPVLVDWINETHIQFSLLIETYYLTISIIDRFLQANETTKRTNLQLVGVAAMFIASKYEEMYPPPLSDFAYITDNTYSAEEIIAMEKFILKKLDFNLSAPLVIHFTRRFSKTAAATFGDVDYDHTMSKYFTELASLENRLVHQLPSAIAAAAVFMSLKLISMPDKSNHEIWTTTLQHYTTHTLDYLRPIIRIIAEIALNAPESKEKAVYNKYCMLKYEIVARCHSIYGPVMKSLLQF